ncbi:von Willebrand factor D and EGF domain-containing protein-like [Branchiostoma floridae]|uniref:von Willebrand factor D and EGF domain-containing protein-like n=1 Tax=Branchiostoma floridae TaxID=7739 RepID=A0A9J7LHN9_BRAFL|nr:von Willebrand factor D and EGF domain-containing protein-like [Branchiostoma floridae]
MSSGQGAVKVIVLLAVIMPVLSGPWAGRTIHNHQACESMTLHLGCLPGEALDISFANYGHIGTKDCGSPMPPGGCRAPDSLAIVRGMCQGKQRCSVPAANTVFGDPCQNVGKYLEVNYECKGSEDPCEPKEHDSIDDIWRSAGHNSTGRAEAELLDDQGLAEGWYRFVSEAGGEMPTACVPVNSCGTRFPVWMDGTVPTVNQTQDVTGCINQGGCCDSTVNLKVKNCSTFLVYKLSPLPAAHPSAYCAGDRAPCPEGQGSPNGGFYPACTDMFPKLRGAPTLNYQADQTESYFLCDFDGPDWSNITWVVEWLLDDTVILTEQMPGWVQTAYLDQADILLNTEVSCQVHGHFVGSNITTVPDKSDPFYAGIVVGPQDLTVHEDGGPANFTVHSTIALNCDVMIVNNNGYLGRPDVLLDQCSLSFGTGSWGIDNPQTVTVWAIRDFQTDGDQYVQIDVIPSADCDVTPSGNTHGVLVTTIDQDTSEAHASGDPHYITFDRRRYDWYGVGDFVLHRSKGRPFEVHSRVWRCWAVSCNCGVAVREGDDVITIDMCDGPFGQTAPAVRLKSQKEPAKGMRVTRSRSGRNFKVSLPSGAEVRTDAYNWGMNLHVKVPSDDFGKTEGLFGTFDHDSSNDFRASDETISDSNAFSWSWRIPAGQSLFDSLPDNADTAGQAMTSRYDGSVLCACTTNGPNCGDPNTVPTFRNDFDIDITDTLVQRRARGPRYLRSTRVTDKSTRAPFPVGANATWPTPSGITLENATVMCKEAAMTSPAFAACAMLSNVDVFSGVEDCVEDIKLTDNLAFLQQAAMLMEELCREEALKNVTLYDQKDENSTALPPSFVGSSLCPGRCSLRGQCVNATCHCDTGYTSSDCSVDMTKPPALVAVRHGHTCDVRSGVCDVIGVVGDGFLDSRSLRCHVERHTDTARGRQRSALPATAAFMSFREVECTVDQDVLIIDGNPDENTGIPVSNVTVAISNDGRLNSDMLQVTIYDSYCQECDETGVCRPKVNACEIKGFCYPVNGSHPADNSRYCNPSINRSDWTHRPDTEEQQPKYIVGIAVGTAVGTVVLVLAVAFILKIKKQKSVSLQAS